MQRLNQAELSATHRIFNLVELLIGPYYGHQTLDITKEYVSGNKWIMFPEKSVQSLREGANFPTPNIFISFDEGKDIQDDSTGKVNGNIGLTYHNVEAMIWLDSTLKRKSKGTTLVNLINNLGPDWVLEIQHKIKTNSPDSVPRYSTYDTLNTSTVTREQIRQCIADSNQSLLRAGDTYSGNPVLWNVTVFVLYKQITEATFNIDVKKAFDLFFKALTI
jgi:hypothetical protein